MLAFAGLFALFAALARPVDLWRVSVHSHRGQPLHASATIETNPAERITESCLSLGSQSDAPDSDAPFLNAARLTLNPAATRVDIRTDFPIQSPTLALVLRVQCPGEMFYARHFSLLIPPAPAAAPPARTVPGFKLKVAEGETVESLTRLLIPGDRKLRRKMIREVLASNPHAFPDGRTADVAPGTLLFFPDLRILRDLPERAAPAAPGTAGIAKPAPAPAKPVPPKPKPAPQEPAAPPAAQPSIAEPTQAADASEPEPAASPARPTLPAPASSAARPSETVRLKTALQLDANPTPQQCAQALALCGALAVPELESRARRVEQDTATLRLRQDSIEQQLIRLEKSLQALQRSVEQAPARAPAPAAAPVKPEIRTVVRTEPMQWYYWLGVLGAIAAAGLGGFVLGRKRARSNAVVEDDARLDRMLASAAATIREMEASPTRRQPDTVPKPAKVRVETPAAATPPRRPPAPVIRTPPPVPAAPRVEPGVQAPAVSPPIAPAAGSETPMARPGEAVDLELESGPTESPEGLSTDVLFEMDQALDNTRSMFTDVDRFIALGRTQNALSLLQFQVHKDPKDRDAWIKLMAIYRQEKMDVELAKAAREFKRNFPDENPPVV